MISEIVVNKTIPSTRLPALYKYIGICQNLKGYVCLFTSSKECLIIVHPNQYLLSNIIRADCSCLESWQRLTRYESVVLTNED